VIEGRARRRPVLDRTPAARWGARGARRRLAALHGVHGRAPRGRARRRLISRADRWREEGLQGWLRGVSEPTDAAALAPPHRFGKRGAIKLAYELQGRSEFLRLERSGRWENEGRAPAHIAGRSLVRAASSPIA
jgi:hypothetical protein